ncbi:DUF6745 domain-containing protein [Dactylosporangium sp. CA-092794]|uniref:DUF6745 domain-containing protein n=1 Tax=Dactylosporangium sp. CA-092794 TaxID=3239929 RepID=UPI003D8DBBCD
MAAASADSDVRATTLGAVSAKWLAAGLSTAPADRAAAADAVRLAYRSAGLPEPAHVVWFASPLAGARAAALLTGRRDLPGAAPTGSEAAADAAVAAQLRAQGCPPVPGTAGPSVRAAVRTAPWAASRSEAHELLGPDGWAALWSACGAEVWRLVNDRIATPLRTHLRGELPVHARAVLLDAVGGQHDAGWLAAFDASPSAPTRAAGSGHGAPAASRAASGSSRGVADSGSSRAASGSSRGVAGVVPGVSARRVSGSVPGGSDSAHGSAGAASGGPVFSAGPVGAVWATAAPVPAEAALHAVQRLAGLAGVARSSSWWWPYANVAILTDRPDALHRDNLGRLHAADAPALHYRDGYALHAWRGMPIPSDLVDRLAHLTYPQIAAERNAELRRVMVEHFGYDRYLREAGAQKVSEDESGVLWRLAFADDEPLTMVEVVNSTPEPDGTSRVYWLRVPPQTRTAREGVAWTFGLTEEEYRPLIQT